MKHSCSNRYRLFSTLSTGVHSICACGGEHMSMITASCMVGVHLNTVEVFILFSNDNNKNTSTLLKMFN